MTPGTGLRVMVHYNEPILPHDHPDFVAEAEVIEVAEAVAEALASQGFAAALHAARPPVERVLADLRAAAPDLVFNLIEGFDGAGAGATLLTGLLELAGLAYTGCPPDALSWCLSKGRAKALLRGLGLPTAEFLVIEPGDEVPAWPGPWPVIVKPDGEDASLGIDQRSVAVDPEALDRQVARLRSEYGGRVLVETYLAGREFNVGVLDLGGPEALPVSEVAYEPLPGAWPILCYESKWITGSPADLATPILCPAAIDADLSARLRRLAVAAFVATGCRDYARVDLRLDAHGSPMILEVNPNPDIAPWAGLARGLKASGRDYAATLAALAHQAIRRGPRSRLAAGAGLEST
jgi:D-alanine-D-alanine ligase